MRYSEDIDFIQLQEGPIGPLFDRLKEKLAFLGEPTRKQKNRNNILIFRFKSEIPPVTPLRLKVEINCREHTAFEGIRRLPFEIKSRWFTDTVELSTFSLEELLGSKMRAFYQRSSGRDLFDLWHAINTKNVNMRNVILCFNKFIRQINARISRKDFEENLEQKIKTISFLNDIRSLLKPEIDYNPNAAFELVMEKLISKLD